jgi:Lar family restriction alleviation protein
MTDLPKIAPCPFCGSEHTRLPTSSLSGAWYFVECHACDATGPTRADPVEAVAVWNRVALAVASQEASK